MADLAPVVADVPALTTGDGDLPTKEFDPRICLADARQCLLIDC